MRMNIVFKKKCMFMVTIALILAITISPLSSVFANGDIGSAAVYVANNNSYAVTAEGEVYSWGVNQHGKLGIGRDDLSDEGRAVIPEKIPNFTNVKTLATGSDHIIALKNDGTVWGWGRNNMGQLGQGHTEPHFISPVQISGLDNVKEIYAGNNFSMVVKTDGTVYSWGLQENGRLGQGEISENILVPTQIEGLTNVVSLAVGNGHVLALKENGTVWAWGETKLGKIGNGTVGVNKEDGEWSPVELASLQNIKTIIAGNEHSFAIDNKGQVFGWGNNHRGQLGIGDTEDRSTPVLVQPITDLAPKKLGVGGNFSFAILDDGSAWTWGDNGHGRLGAADQVSTDPAEAFSIVPVRVVNIEFTEGDYLEGVIQIASRNNHVVALLNDGTVVAWGANQHGQAGDGFTTPAQLEPALTEIPKLFTVKEVVIDNNDSAIAKEAQAGHQLPNTAGDNYNLLMVGTLLLVVAGTMSFWQKRKVASKELV
ncbi:RCC1 domain-containing protein [Desulfuribacillus alkaliarsenatis]|uniref:RCC1-like domain-containing protein n=1 Tax=Desulfuribacillus alkaliarsenatis TaxID=766136 RepID=A0A1E5G4M9_9FIRM|nr:hypothetical protein [Desulfuribacillus alkaliarsenatis]OEF98131.1 hypothetical protein BHF68_00105 [Desulfuribacillus alkaliarsenatis]